MSVEGNQAELDADAEIAAIEQAARARAQRSREEADSFTEPISVTKEGVDEEPTVDDAIIAAIERGARDRAEKNRSNDPNEPDLLRASKKASLELITVTCATCRSDFIALGTANGDVILLHTLDFSEVTRFRSGARRTFGLDFNKAGNCLVTSDYDGRVAVHVLVRPNPTRPNMILAEEAHVAQFVSDSHPLRVAIDPLAEPGGDLAFLCGGSDGRIKLTKKTYWPFGSSTDDIAPVSYLDGAVFKLTWIDDLVVWTTVTGHLRMRDQRRNLWISMVPEDALEGERVDDFCWEDETHLFLISDLVIRVIKVDYSHTKRHAVVSVKVDLASPVLYAMPFGGRNGTILTVGVDGLVRQVDRMSSSVLRTTWLVPEESSSLVKPANLFFHDIYWSSPASVDTNGPENGRVERIDEHVYRRRRLTVQKEADLPFLFAVHNVLDGSSTGGYRADLVVLRSRTAEDELQFALEGNDYERALKICVVTSDSLSVTYHEVADSYMTFLLGQRKHEDLVDVMPRVFPSTDLSGWSKWCAVLAQRGELFRLAHVIPIPGLSPTLYDALLSQLLEYALTMDDESGHNLYYDTLKRCLASCDASQCIDQLQKAIKHQSQKNTVILRKALALAYSATPERVEEGFWAMLDSKSQDALDVLERRQEGVSLILKVIERQRAQELCDLNPVRFSALVAPFTGFTSLSTASMFTEEESNTFNSLFPSLIFQLRSSSNTEKVALTHLRRWNSSRRMTTTGESLELANQEVELCARLEPLRLLELLRDSNGYSPDKALALCQSNPGLKRETVFLLQRMGAPRQSKEAMEILAYEMNDLESALEYAERENLFFELVKVCVSPEAPAGVAIELLSRAGSYSIDPACLVRALPSGLPDTRSKLVKLFRDVRANLKTREIANDVFRKGAARASDVATKQFSRGVRLRAGVNFCAWCKCVLHDKQAVRVRDLVIFRSGDGYHHDCLTSAWESLYKYSVEMEVGISEKLPATSLLKLHVSEFIRSLERDLS